VDQKFDMSAQLAVCDVDVWN